MQRETAAALNPAGAAPAPAALALPVPANLVDFMAMYGSEEFCLEALINARWPGGFVCPRCAHGKGWRHANRRLIECASCGRLRLEAIDDATGEMLQTVVESRVEQGATAHTDGLILNSSTGQITGTPTVTGTVSFDVRAIDTSVNEAITGTFEITINTSGGGGGSGGGGDDDGGCSTGGTGHYGWLILLGLVGALAGIRRLRYGKA